MIRQRPGRWWLAIALVVAWPAAAPAAGPADELLQRAAPDAGVTLVVEDLAGNLEAFLATPLAAGLKDLPAVRAWRESAKARAYWKARGEIEAALHADSWRIADGLLGRAVVLALYLDPGDPPDRARGLFLTRVKDRDLLRRLLREIDDADRRSGALVESATRHHGGAAYTVRTFRPGTKPAEYLAVLGEETLAWSNAEELILGAIDRGNPGGKPGPGLGDGAGFRAARKGLPVRAAASLLVDPRFLERLLAADPRPKSPEDGRGQALAGRYLAALTYAGAALEWRDGLALHVHQVIDPAKAAEPPRRWAAGGGLPGGAIPRAPASALAVAAGSVDFAAAFDLALGLLPEADRPRAGHLLALIRGLLLGKDLRAEVLPRLGPGVLLYLDAPTGPGRWPWVAATAGHPEVTPAIENALRTALALYALGNDPSGRVEAREAVGARATGLEGARFAYGVGGGQVVAGSSIEAVAAHLEAGTQAAQSRLTPLERTRTSYFPSAETFAFVDLEALQGIADARRDAIARALAARRGSPEAEARRDLDQALALMALFRAAYVTAEIDPHLTSAHHTLGLLPRDREPATGR